MAPRNNAGGAGKNRAAAAAAEADEGEVFTDLISGEPDPENPARDARGGIVVPDDAEIKDEDLEVEPSDEEEEPAEEEPGEGDEEIPAEEEEEVPAEEEEEPVEEEPEPVQAVEEFDPKDVEILALKATNLETRKLNTKAALERAEADIKAAKTAMEKAKEAGDSAGDVAATEAYAKAIQAQSTANATLQSITAEEQGLIRIAQDLQRRAPKDDKGNPIFDRRVSKTERPAETGKERGSKLFPKWSKHNAWFNNQRYEKQRKALIAIDRGLNAEGRLKINDPKYFAELGRRFNAEFPGLFKNLDGKPIATGQRRRGNGERPPNTAGGGNGGGTPERRTNPNDIKLTQADLTQMERFGFDPTNKEHRRNWLIEKRQSARAGA